MSTPASLAPGQDVVYPDCDGEPMSDNTLQFRWIVTLQGNIDARFAADPNVFVAGDLLWYPVEGNNLIRTAPDVLVAIGRPKGYRGSYMQWREDNIAPQVVWEVVSPSNRAADLDEKFEFYQRYGVEEYYLYDPDRGTLRGWQRAGVQLVEIEDWSGYRSPRLGVRIEIAEDRELGVYHPDGRRFLTFVELTQQADRDRERAERFARHLRSLGIDPESLPPE